ncbi:MAG: cystathionine beta-lyase [Pseudomonadota bacterium]
MSASRRKIRDTLVQGGRPARVEGRHVNMPIELGSTMVFDTLTEFERARARRLEPGTLYYGRYGNAASFQLEELIADLDGATGVTITSSGVAAISLSLLALTRPGTHVLVADNVYGNTRAFCDTLLTSNNVDIQYFDPMIGGDVADLFRDNTVAVMFEAPGSGTFDVCDIRAVAEACREHSVVSVFDGTWATPIFCQPLELGVDVLVYSASKYLSGHSDCMMGVISCKDSGLFMRIRKCVMAVGDKTGGQEVMLALRGLRTLDIRMTAIEAAALEVAGWLAEQPQVKQLLHPAFESCPGHQYWRRDFSGSSGLFGVIFYPCSSKQVAAFVDTLQHFGIGVSWGGYESLVLPMKPVRTAKPCDETGQLVRFNVGLEDTKSLIADLSAALPKLGIVSE